MRLQPINHPTNRPKATVANDAAPAEFGIIAAISAYEAQKKIAQNPAKR